LTDCPDNLWFHLIPGLLERWREQVGRKKAPHIGSTTPEDRGGPKSTLGKVEIESGEESGLVRQDLLKRPLNPIDFLADYSDRLLVFRWVGQRSDSFKSASYLMIPSPNEVEPCGPLLAISVNAADEPSGEPGKCQTKQHLKRNTIGHAVKL
jgi:hypothetical protein